MKNRIVILAAAVAALLLVPNALAGGWAVITLKAWPENVQAGEQQTIEFVVRAHGVERISGFDPVVLAEHVKTGETLRVPAYPLKRTGDYAADLVFPQAGEWRWGISYLEDGQFPQTMPVLTVGTGAGAPAQRPASDRDFSPGYLIAALGAIATAGGVILYVTRPSRAALVTAGTGALVIAFGLLAFPRVQARAGAAEAEPAAAAELTDVERGRLLFQAKGCIVCHAHAELREDYEGITTDIGPELTWGSKRGREFLVKWLADPAYFKPETFMPDLDLSEAEIDALAAFIMDELDK